MWSSSTYHSLAAQLTRLATIRHHRDRDRAAPRFEPAAEGCGCCPSCGEFVFVEFPEAADHVACPQCGKQIDSVEPLGKRDEAFW